MLPTSDVACWQRSRLAHAASDLSISSVVQIRRGVVFVRANFDDAAPCCDVRLMGTVFVPCQSFGKGESMKRHMRRIRHCFHLPAVLGADSLVLRSCVLWPLRSSVRYSLSGRRRRSQRFDRVVLSLTLSSNLSSNLYLPPP